MALFGTCVRNWPSTTSSVRPAWLSDWVDSERLQERGPEILTALIQVSCKIEARRIAAKIAKLPELFALWPGPCDPAACQSAAALRHG